METFSDLKELITALRREEALISEMFSKRKTLDYKLSYALEILDDSSDRLNYLTERGVLRENGTIVELDDIYVEFFEQVLAINESLNIAYIDENLVNITDTIEYYLNENNDNRKLGYLRSIKKALRKIGSTTLKNVIDLRRNIEETFKNEINYKNKQLKLEKLDKKRQVINTLIDKTLQLIHDKELTFFNLATDEELKTVITGVKYNFRECSHNLIEIEKQIIDYLNQIQLQGRFIEKLRKIKHIKDQFVIKAESDIEQVLAPRCDLIFETDPKDSLKLSVDYLRNDDAATHAIRAVAHKRHDIIKQTIPIADQINEHDLINTEEEIPMIDLEHLKQQFFTSNKNLFDFLGSYQFSVHLEFPEQVTLFCQMASQFENELRIENGYVHSQGVEFAIIYPQ